MYFKEKSNLGLSLLELLVVVAIIGILLSIVGGAVNISRQDSRDLRRVSDVKQIQLSLGLYHSVYRTYPANLSTLTVGGFISSVPIDPAGTNYVYTAQSSNTSYCLGALMDRKVPTEDANCLGGSYGVNYYEVKP